MAPDRKYQINNEDRIQEELRAYKIKTEYLKLTLNGLQSMLEAEKQKLKREKGEVEGLAREKGLVLLGPGPCHEGPIFNSDRSTLKDKQEICQTPAISEIAKTPTPPAYVEQDQNIVLTNNREDWGQGDNYRTGCHNTGDDCLFSSGIMWQPQHYGDYSSALWDREVINGDPCSLERDMNPEEIFNSGYLDNTLYGIQSTLQTFNYPAGFQSSLDIENLLNDTSASITSKQNIVALLKEVDHITKAIDELDNP